MIWRSVVVACLMLLCAAPSYAQFDSANISGVVQDTTGAILPGVDLTLTNVGTKFARQAVTNEAFALLHFIAARRYVGDRTHRACRADR